MSQTSNRSDASPVIGSSHSLKETTAEASGGFIKNFFASSAKFSAALEPENTDTAEQPTGPIGSASELCVTRNNVSNKTLRPDVLSGLAGGSVTQSSIYSDQVRFNASGGHGFAAEQGNHLWDKLSLNDARIVGDDNAINGADRIVNGVNIQSKYCSSGGACVRSCFDDAGNWRYLNADGSVMQIEVPRDMYDAAVQSMRDRITKGEIPGVTDPAKAEELIKAGKLTYDQAVRIAKFGTIEGLTFDTLTGLRTAAMAGSISAAVSFAMSVWNGEDWRLATRRSALTAFQVGGSALAISVITSQLGRTGLDQVLRGASMRVVNLLNQKVIERLVLVTTGRVMSGQAAKGNLAKVLRGNVVTGVVTTVVLSSTDIISMFRGRISGAQLAKNVASTATSVAAGTGGYMAGAALGSFIPGLGTAVGAAAGGIVGSLAAGYAANKLSSSLLDLMITDDAVEMQLIVEAQLRAITDDYLLNAAEIGEIVSKIVEDDYDAFIKDLHASDDREQHAYRHLERYTLLTIADRPKVTLPPPSFMLHEEGAVLGELLAAHEAGELDLECERAPITEVTLPEVLFHVFNTAPTAKTGSVYIGKSLDTPKGRKKLANAVISYANVDGNSSNGKFLAMFDITLFGSGKDGLVLTDEKLFAKGLLDSAICIDLAELKEISISETENELIVNEYSFDFTHSELREDFEKLAQALSQFLNQKNIVEASRANLINLLRAHALSRSPAA